MCRLNGANGWSIFNYMSKSESLSHWIFFNLETALCSIWLCTCTELLTRRQTLSIMVFLSHEPQYQIPLNNFRCICFVNSLQKIWDWYVEMISGFAVKPLRGNGHIFILKIQKYFVIILSRVKRWGVIKCKCSNMTMG